MSKGWGRIMVGARLEKMVEAGFVSSWSVLLTSGMRKGDRWEVSEGMPPHMALNALVRKLLKSDCDTLFTLDSDAEIEKDFLNTFRDYEPGWEFDGLQAFYVRRGWPPEAIWLKRDDRGILRRSLITGETTEEVGVVGTHAALFRREIFERILGDKDPETFDWFYYPRHSGSTEDGAFSIEAIQEFGFHFGATTVVKANHITHLPIGWESYQDYLFASGQIEGVQIFDTLVREISKFTRETPEDVMSKVLRGSENPRQAWESKTPRTSQEVRDFYGAPDNGYLYDLAAWNASPFYVKIVRALRNLHDQKVLIIGSGVGSEIDALVSQNKVTVFELPGILRDFSKSRFEDQVQFLEGNTLLEAEDHLDLHQFDLIVAIDVLEHIHPDEIQGVLDSISELWDSTGTLVLHNNFGDHDLYPMHYDHSKVFQRWVESLHLTQTSEISWAKESI
jgi:hypothetical protein